MNTNLFMFTSSSLFRLWYWFIIFHSIQLSQEHFIRFAFEWFWCNLQILCLVMFVVVEVVTLFGGIQVINILMLHILAEFHWKVMVINAEIYKNKEVMHLGNSCMWLLSVVNIYWWRNFYCSILTFVRLQALSNGMKWMVRCAISRIKI